ncbi:MAG: hypothetical protein ACPG49_09210 [Chitinophagales bacterium]
MKNILQYKNARNIKLLSEESTIYKHFLKSVIVPKIKPKPKEENSYSSILGKEIEKIIIQWISNSKQVLDENILFFQIKNSRTWRQKSREVDFIFEDKEMFWLGEIKTSINSKAFSKAIQQLRASYYVLKKLKKQVIPILIFVDLRTEYSDYLYTPFAKSLSEVQLEIHLSNDIEFRILELNPIEIYQWGLAENIVTDKELLIKALEEANNNYEIQLKRRELKDKGIEVKNYPDELKRENERKKSKLEDRITWQDDKKESYKNVIAQKLKNALKKND